VLILCLCQNFEFDVYEKYADDVLKENGRMRLNALLQNSDAAVTMEVNGQILQSLQSFMLIWTLCVMLSFVLD
jgi:hypothetical protein